MKMYYYVTMWGENYTPENGDCEEGTIFHTLDKAKKFALANAQDEGEPFAIFELHPKLITAIIPTFKDVSVSATEKKNKQTPAKK